MLKEYLNKFNLEFNKNKDKIMESFIKYYGEEYRERIENRINNINIINFIPLYFDYDKLSTDMVYYIDQCREDYMENNNIDELLDRVVIDNNCKGLSKELRYYLEPSYLMQSTYISDFNLVILPIVFSIEDITHELNHAVIENVLCDNPRINVNGLELSIRDENNFNLIDTTISEILIERMAFDIEDFEEEYGIKKCNEFCWQHNYFRFINKFYIIFKDLIKYTFINGNRDMLINAVGKENYEAMVKIIEMTRENELKYGDRIFDEDSMNIVFNTINKIVDRMIEHYNLERSKQLSKKELKDTLDNKGKILNLDNYYELKELK